MYTSIVVQGPVTTWTVPFVKRYCQLTDDVVFSTWEGETLDFKHPHLRVIHSRPPTNPGRGNRNLQIVSSLAGTQVARHRWCVKVRSDMFLPEFVRMQNYVIQHHTEHDLFVLSMYTKLVFHPRDHVFWGKTFDLQDLFDIPLDVETGHYHEWVHVRSEAYLGVRYYVRHGLVPPTFTQNMDEYLPDWAPKREQAMELHKALQGILFHPFPRVEIEWPKHYPGNYYPWDTTRKIYGEYTAIDSASNGVL